MKPFSDLENSVDTIFDLLDVKEHEKRYFLRRDILSSGIKISITGIGTSESLDSFNLDFTSGSGPSYFLEGVQKPVNFDYYSRLITQVFQEIAEKKPCICLNMSLLNAKYSPKHGLTLVQESPKDIIIDPYVRF